MFLAFFEALRAIAIRSRATRELSKLSNRELIDIGFQPASFGHPPGYFPSQLLVA